MRSVAMVIAIAACGGTAPRPPPARTPPLAPSGPRLPPPPVGDPSVRGATYLGAVAGTIQPVWAQFLEDCRLRLPRQHPLNDPALVAVAELIISPAGHIDHIRITQSSGNGDFDTAMFDVLGDASPLPRPPAALASDDDNVHLRWLFARDRRQAGPATAQVVTVELPLIGVVEQLLERGQTARAASRVAAARLTDQDRLAAAERVMIATLRAALASPDLDARRTAVEAIGRAGVHALSGEVHRLVAPATTTDLRLAAIGASAALGDPAVAPALLADLRGDFANRPRVALAKTGALVTLGRGAEVAPVIRAEIDVAPDGAGSGITALAALALAPDPTLAAKLADWFAHGEPPLRAAVCTALPAATPARAPALIVRGLRDGDATVRAACVDAAARLGKPPAIDPATLRRLRDMVRDRDHAVRARVIAALLVLDTRRGPEISRAINDPAPQVRAAAAAGASDPELRSLTADRDPDVRTAAIATLADRARDVVARAAVDPAPQVRKAAVVMIDSDDVLSRLSADDSPDVATAARIRQAMLRGRADTASAYLGRLAEPSTGATERVRIALAWLLAR